jgi:hypothetical protein
VPFEARASAAWMTRSAPSVAAHAACAPTSSRCVKHEARAAERLDARHEPGREPRHVDHDVAAAAGGHDQVRRRAVRHSVVRAEVIDVARTRYGERKVVARGGELAGRGATSVDRVRRAGVERLEGGAPAGRVCGLRDGGRGAADAGEDVAGHPAARVAVDAGRVDEERGAGEVFAAGRAGDRRAARRARRGAAVGGARRLGDRARFALHFCGAI